MNDWIAVALTVVLLAGNAFFVGAEFSLISARRDRLETLVAQGRKRAQTVVDAGETPLVDARRVPNSASPSARSCSAGSGNRRSHT